MVGAIPHDGMLTPPPNGGGLVVCGSLPVCGGVASGVRSRRMPVARVEAVVWDIGRVLVQWDLPRIWRDAIPDPDKRAWFTTNVVTEAWHFRHDEGESMEAMVAERIAEFPEYAAEIERYRTHWLEALPGPVEGTLPLIERLAAREVPQYSITNFGADAFAMFRPTFPILDHMRDIVVSGEERLVKPHRAIFDLAVQRFGHAPETMLFIDDNAANIAAADALGWQVHHFTDDAAALEADLVERGLL
ncbi:HAD family hydrolase [Novosphingobium nitrogenifigens DSM 19370]|uniref:HAD family hydrolase n=2 Tax=Novosphingobium nitrogenifigens TaxID=378548 RepID=F1Z5C5_9SPHN|nr:HAD-IA family hydrolase [Novosphingobium nitrogenifigens]EGD60303.1 HAD family hydrolase [Novosphingobium nitrogenifigens DSM 19370]